MSELQGTSAERVRRALNWFDNYFIRGNSKAPSKSLYVLGVANEAVSELEARVAELEAENARLATENTMQKIYSPFETTQAADGLSAVAQAGGESE